MGEYLQRLNPEATVQYLFDGLSNHAQTQVMHLMGLINRNRQVGLVNKELGEEAGRITISGLGLLLGWAAVNHASCAWIDEAEPKKRSLFTMFGAREAIGEEFQTTRLEGYVLSRVHGDRTLLVTPAGIECTVSGLSLAGSAGTSLLDPSQPIHSLNDEESQRLSLVSQCLFTNIRAAQNRIDETASIAAA